jgi:hypothetical protein
MATVSEAVFEQFLADNALKYCRIEEAGNPRPDYWVDIAGCRVFFEVKELSEDENFKTGHLQVSSRIMGDHIRAKIKRARKQMQFARQQDAPAVLLIYNNIDPIHLFGTEDQDFIAAMYGAYTLRISITEGTVVDSFHGSHKSVTEEMNTSFSAVGRLAPEFGKLVATVFENTFATVPLPFDSLPSCFDIRRVQVQQHD